METFLALLALLCGEFTGHRWIPHTKASDAELWCFLWSANNGDAGDLRRKHAHYDVIVMGTDLVFLEYSGLGISRVNVCLKKRR